MYTLLKSQVGPWPEPVFPPGIDFVLEASYSRRRLYPVTLVYSAYLVFVLAWAWYESALLPALGCALGGLAAWTIVEYLVHRFVLHVAFPAGRHWPSRVLHTLFDASHADHHARPWDGHHINGHLDTLFVSVWLVPLSLLAPRHTFAVGVAALFACYVAEEWAHHAMHFCNFRFAPFQYARRRHLYHHSRHGKGTAFGITSGVWDVVFGTRIPLPHRARLLSRAADSPATTTPPSSAPSASSAARA